MVLAPTTVLVEMRELFIASRGTANHSHLLFARAGFAPQGLQSGLADTLTTPSRGCEAEGQQNKLGNYHCNNRIYSIGHGRWLSPDQAASPFFNLYGYVGNAALQFTDPTGLYPESNKCVIVISLSTDRSKVGDMFVYNKDGEPCYYAPVRGDGQTTKDGKNIGQLEENGDTPTGTYVGKVGPAQDNNENDALGKQKVIRLTGSAADPKAHPEPLDGNAVDAWKKGRRGLLIHGGRKNRCTEVEGSIYEVVEDTVKEKGADGKVVDKKIKKFQKKENQKLQRPMGTSGCARVHEDSMGKIVGCLDGCDEITVYVTEKGFDDPNTVPADGFGDARSKTKIASDQKGKDK
ncbi:MAG: hypothetical protein BroJett014_27680 [Planctomycetota bacterium]|nr:MAG: hypothetical protein BroJett014_27680 [Planctomycetota bacterium]